MKADTYEIKDGKLLRDGVHIGNLEGDEMKLLPDFTNYKASVTRWVNSQGAEESTAIPIPQRPQGTADSWETMPPVLSAEEKLALAQVGMRKEAENQARKSADLYREDLAFAERTGCPPPPKKNPQFGDKTPAFVDWLHQYRHDQFMIRFGVTGRGKVPIFTKNQHSGLEEQTGERDVYFAKRKNHLTEKDASREGLTDEMDWNA